MLDKPKSLNGLGLVQVLLATSFVIWLLFFPQRGDDFAWPVVPELTAMFIGTAFIARAYLGFFLWREKKWYRLRWQVWGNLGFLAVIFVGTLWHVGEMNWSASIVMAHIWVLAYTVEPLILILIEPRGPEANEPLLAELRQGPIFLGLKRVMGVLWVTMMILGALLFINPEFMDTRWPWPLDPFDARIMAAFFVLAALWALRVYFLEDWAEAKPAILGLAIMGSSLFILWLVTVSRFREINRWTYGIVLGVFTLLAIYYYWRQERAKPGSGEAENPAGA
jgi:hypothetical protein